VTTDSEPYSKWIIKRELSLSIVGDLPEGTISWSWMCCFVEWPYVW